MFTKVPCASNAPTRERSPSGTGGVSAARNLYHRIAVRHLLLRIERAHPGAHDAVMVGRRAAAPAHNLRSGDGGLAGEAGHVFQVR